MDFLSIVMFLGLYYIRPQEWSAIAFKLQPIKVTMLLALVAMALKYRERPFFKELFHTPHDWIILLYFTWVIGTAPSISGTFSDVYSHLLFYLVTVQALTNIERIQNYLNWWTFFIFAVVLMALAGEYGVFDPMNSYDLTHGWMKGRLILRTSIFNNPNALGHSVVPAIIMLYFLLFWKRPIFAKIATIPLMFFPLFCLYLTLSKGAFISGFATVLSALTYRRPKIVQLLIFLAAFTMGWAGLKMLPRMQDLEHAKAEGGIQGRVAAFQWGFDSLTHRATGVGYGRFMTAFQREHRYLKAPHSSYVQIGAELGIPGLFLFLGILYTCLRTLMTVKTTNIAEERARRILFVLLISFMISSWMVGWSYRASFFLMVAVIAAFHRQMLARAQLTSAPSAETVVEPELVLAIGGTEAPVRRSENPLAPPTVTAQPAFRTFAATEYEPELVDPGIRWNRFGWVDFALISVMLVATIKFWEFIMHHI
jgi:O-antigen ligase